MATPLNYDKKVIAVTNLGVAKADIALAALKLSESSPKPILTERQLKNLLTEAMAELIPLVSLRSKQSLEEIQKVVSRVERKEIRFKKSFF